MKYIPILLLVVFCSCGLRQKKTVSNTPTLSCIAEDTLHKQTNYTLEDTVHYQIGGQLYYLEIDPSDSITVIGTHYWQPKNDEFYREYQFIVHNRYSRGHHTFEASTLDSIYNVRSEDFRKEYESRIDTIPSRNIDPVIEEFNGYWVYLNEYNGNYYLNDEWAGHHYLYIADSVLFEDYQELSAQKILEAAPLPKDGISILLDYFGEEHLEKIELFEKKRDIYRIIYSSGAFSLITPARSIHNFEIIQYTNNTGDEI